MSTTPDLRKRRIAVIREHMESENVHDFHATLATATGGSFRARCCAIFERS